MPAASLDAVLRAGLRLQAEAPARFEAEATGAKLCNLYTSKKNKDFQFPDKIGDFKPLRHSTQRYTLKKTKDNPGVEAHYAGPIHLYSKFGDSTKRTDQPYMIVTKVKVTRGVTSSGTKNDTATTFQVFYKIAIKPPIEYNDQPVMNDEEYSDFSYTFSALNCVDSESKLAADHNVKTWRPALWAAKLKNMRKGNSLKSGLNVVERSTENQMLYKALEQDVPFEMAHLVWKMAKAIKKANK
jgi:hypothetical protein